MIQDDDNKDTSPSTEPAAPATEADAPQSTVPPIVTARPAGPDSGTVNDPDRTPPDVGPEESKLSATNAEQGEGETGVLGDRPPAAEDHIEVAADPTGERSNRVEGTIQAEPTPEELPSDAKIAPLAEQVNPRDALAVGAKPQPETIAGVEQPEEGEKNVLPDTSDPTNLLPDDEHSNQHDDAERAAEDAQRDADRGRV